MATRKAPAMRRTGASVQGFLACVPGEQRREAARFSPRGPHLAIYLVGEFENRHQSVLARLGPRKTGKGCLYIKRLDDVDQDALRELIDRSVRVRKGIDRASG
jgi:hypothetical protein